MGVRAVGGEAARRPDGNESGEEHTTPPASIASSPNQPTKLPGARAGLRTEAVEQPRAASSRTYSRGVWGGVPTRAPFGGGGGRGGPRVIFRPRGATSRGASGSTWAAGALASPPSVVRWAGRGPPPTAPQSSWPRAATFLFFFFSFQFFFSPPACLFAKAWQKKNCFKVSDIRIHFQRIKRCVITK